MVKVLSLHIIAGLILSLLTYLHFTSKNYFGECNLKIITYASFYDGAGKSIFAEYENEFLCKLQVQVLKTAGMLAQVKNLSQEYDVVIGLDHYQIEDMDMSAFRIDPEDFKHLKYGLEKYYGLYRDAAFKMDSAPLTYFIRTTADISDASENMGFYTFQDFLIFLKEKNLKIAIPSPNTSVLGSLYLNWIMQFEPDYKEFLKDKVWVYVSSWTEAFGLFEKKLVGGFLSYETSQMHYAEQNKVVIENNQKLTEPKDTVQKVFKVEIQSGHPDYEEFFVVSSQSQADKDDKYRFVRFMYSTKVQEWLKDKNYMWPAAVNFADDKGLKTLKVVPLKKRLERKELLKSWKEIR